MHYPTLVFGGNQPPREEIARVLAGIPAPTEADYRRAVSAAYFALFHATTLAAARHLSERQVRFQRYRSTRRFRHQDLRNVAQWVSGEGTPAQRFSQIVRYLRGSERVRELADTFVTLSDERTKADYDHFAQFNSARALRAIGIATRAVETVERPSFAGSDDGRLFLRTIAEQVAGGG